MVGWWWLPKDGWSGVEEIGVRDGNRDGMISGGVRKGWVRGLGFMRGCSVRWKVWECWLGCGWEVVRVARWMWQVLGKGNVWGKTFWS